MIIVWIIALLVLVFVPSARPATVYKYKIYDSQHRPMYEVKCNEYGKCIVYDINNYYTPSYRIEKGKVYDIHRNEKGEKIGDNN